MERNRVIDELYKPSFKNYERRKVLTYGIDDLWQADLVEMDSGNLKGISKINKGYKYMLNIIDVFSKYAWSIQIKDKTGINVTDGMKNILKDRIPKNLQTDNGKEFYNKNFKELMKLNSINHYSTFSDKKASIIERFNRTLKEKMWKQFTINGNYKWINILGDLVNEYNNTKHSTIGMKPVEVNKKNERKILMNVYNEKYDKGKPKYKIGDIVRISKAKLLFEKGYTRNWSAELFEIFEVNKLKPVFYRIKDLKGEELKGTFYEKELMKTKYPDIYLIEKVIRKKGNKMYVKWLGFDDSHNSWIENQNVNKMK